ncbi:phage integrase N-terminal SAM-like domain-containing protein [Methylocucumis oryzae]|nr:phage integrase N-terminal SAM-like domain-containing protein [Methylocucumis oryzae]
MAVNRHVSSATQNQALSALLFLYREVLGIELPWLDKIWCSLSNLSVRE